jgi:hypothetical protein
MAKPYIGKHFLRHGCYYTGHSIYSDVARWDENKKRFIYLRHKFGFVVEEEVPHPDDGSIYDVFYPYELREEKNV